MLNFLFYKKMTIEESNDDESSFSSRRLIIIFHLRILRLLNLSYKLL